MRKSESTEALSYRKRWWRAVNAGVATRIRPWAVVGSVITPALSGGFSFAIASSVGVSNSQALVIGLIGALLGVAAWLLAILIGSMVLAPSEIDAHVRRERDEARGALETERALNRERVDEGIKAFKLRLSEGNAVRSQIDAWPRFHDDTSRGFRERQDAKQAEIDRRVAEYGLAVEGWLAACVETIATYLDARVPALERRIDYSGLAPTGNIPVTVFQRRKQAAEVYERMLEFQREYEDQSKRDAIS